MCRGRGGGGNFSIGGPGCKGTKPSREKNQKATAQSLSPPNLEIFKWTRIVTAHVKGQQTKKKNISKKKKKQASRPKEE